MMTVLLTPKTIFSDYSSSGQYGKGQRVNCKTLIACGFHESTLFSSSGTYQIDFDGWKSKKSLAKAC